MAFETGTATNVSDLYSKLDLFLTEDCGWTLHHSVASNNKVYKSTGSNTKQDIYIRLQKDLKDNKGIPSHIAWQNQTFNGAKYSHINVFASQYWNESTGAASNQTTGRLGPFFMLVDGNDGSTSRTAYITTALSYAQTNSNWVSLETTFDGSNEDGNIAWDGKNNLYTGGPFSSSVGRVKRKIFLINKF